jgi:hypothetical protein
MYSQGTVLQSAAIKTDRAVSLALFDSVVILLLIPAWIVYNGVILPYLFRGDFATTTSSDWIFLLVLVVYFFTSLATYFKLRNVAKKRVMAVNGTWRAQLPVQPAISQSFSTGTTVEQDSRSRFLTFSLLWLLVLVLLPIMLFYWLVSSLSTPDMTISVDPMTWVTVLVVIVIQVAVYMIYQSRMVSRLEVTPEGLACTYQGRNQALPWSQIRSFSRYTLGRGRNTTTVFEVAGIDDSASPVVVRWRLLRTRFLITIRPDMTPEAYADLLDRLAAHIVAKTNLPLLDFDASAQ